jgi:hypothetical protein
MTGNAFDALTRRARARTRRASLVALGGASLAAFAGASVGQAGKSGKKAKKKCKKQTPACRGFATRLCGEFFLPGPDFDACFADASACCDTLARCQAESFFGCVWTVIETLLDRCDCAS